MAEAAEAKNGNDTASGGEAAATPPPPAPEPAPVNDPVILANRYLIHPANPIKDLAIPSAMAYAVEDRKDPNHQLFALVCTPGVPVRTTSFALLKGNQITGLMPLVEWNQVYWPPFDQVALVAVYERPLGGRLADVLSKEGRINEYDVPKRIIEPLYTALRGLSNLGFPHREIRPTNMFFMDEERQFLALGDCATAPPAHDQPPVFEPVERGMAQPAGRGRGGFPDDLYALGVSIVFLMLGRNPVARLSTEEVHYLKIETGTYQALCGRERIPVSLLEPLRGMLSDDPQERWGLDELEAWLTGRRLTPMQKKPAAKAEGPFSFNNREHHNVRTLAYAFSKNVAEAAAVMKVEGFDAWLRRSYKDVDLADSIKSFVDIAKANASNAHGSDDMLVAKAVSFMDPVGPVRYKGLSFTAEGFGPVLAMEILRQGKPTTTAEVLQREIYTIWFAAQKTYNPDNSASEKAFKQLKGFLALGDFGYGIERCLYELNSTLPCQSPLVRDHFVVEIKDLLPALDKAAKTVDTTSKPMDRHVAAFIAARFNQDIDPHLRAIASEDQDKHIIGIVSLLAFLQWRQKIPPLYGLASWIGTFSAPAIQSYHSRTTRKELEREIPQIVRQGSLPDLFDLLDNPERKQEDYDDFRRAVHEFAEAEAEVQRVEASDTSRAETAIRLGQQAAAMTSIVVSMAAVTILFFMQYF